MTKIKHEQPIICTLVEYNRETQKPTGMMFPIRSCFELTQFNKNFDYFRNYVVISGDEVNRFHNMDGVIDYVKSISPNAPKE